MAKKLLQKVIFDKKIDHFAKIFARPTPDFASSPRPSLETYDSGSYERKKINPRNFIEINVFLIK